MSTDPKDLPPKVVLDYLISPDEFREYLDEVHAGRQTPDEIMAAFAMAEAEATLREIDDEMEVEFGEYIRADDAREAYPGGSPGLEDYWDIGYGADDNGEGIIVEYTFLDRVHIWFMTQKKMAQYWLDRKVN